MRLGELDRARELDRQALAEFERLGVADGIATAVADLGLLDHLQGHYPAALQGYRRALGVYRQAGDRLSEATLLGNIAGIRSQQGDGGGALLLYQQALEIHRELGGGAAEIEAMGNLAVHYRQMGEPGEALRIYEQVVEKSRAAGNEAALGRALNNQGFAYFSLGDWQRAAGYFEQALTLRRRQGDRRGEQATLANLGEVELLRGRPEAARDYHRQALELARGTSESTELISASMLARDLAALGDPAALPLLEDVARKAANAADPALRGLRYREAESRLELGQTAAARDLFAAVLAEEEAAGRTAQAGLAATGLARAERRLHHGEAALTAGRRAIGLLEKQRVAIDNPSLRATLLAARGQAFETFALTAVERAAAEDQPELLLEALALLERGRARGLLDLLAESRRAGGPGGGRPPGRPPRGAAADDLAGPPAGAGAAGQTPGRPAELAAALEAARVKLERIEADLRRGDPRLAALAPAEPVSPAVWRTAIGGRTRLLYFLLGGEKSLVFVVGPASLRLSSCRREPSSTPSPARPPRASASPSEPDPALGELSARMIAPLREQLAGVEKLWIVADGGLHYLPFAALPWPAGPAGPRPAGRAAGRPLRAHQPAVRRGARRAAGAAGPRRRRHRDHRRLRRPGLRPGRRPPPRRRPGSAGRRRHALRQPPAGRASRRCPAPGSKPSGSPRWRPPGSIFGSASTPAGRGSKRTRRGPTVLHLATHGLIDTDHPELSGLALSLFTTSKAGKPDGLLRLQLETSWLGAGALGGRTLRLSAELGCSGSSAMSSLAGITPGVAQPVPRAYGPAQRRWVPELNWSLAACEAEGDRALLWRRGSFHSSCGRFALRARPRSRSRDCWLCRARSGACRARPLLQAGKSAQAGALLPHGGRDRSLRVARLRGRSLRRRARSLERLGPPRGRAATAVAAADRSRGVGRRVGLRCGCSIHGCLWVVSKIAESFPGQLD